MKKLVILFLAISASSAFAETGIFPREVICGKVLRYEFKTSKKSGITRKVNFSSANLIKFTSLEESQSRVASSREELVQVSSANDELSQGILSNSLLDLSVAFALNQTVCLDLGSVAAGPLTLFPMGKGANERSALEQVISLWK